MMIFKLFRTREHDLVFDEKDWVTDKIQKNYTLTLDLGRLKVARKTRFTLCVLQGQRYIYLGEGSETMQGNQLRYYSHFPFSGKVKLKEG